MYCTEAFIHLVPSVSSKPTMHCSIPAMWVTATLRATEIFSPRRAVLRHDATRFGGLSHKQYSSAARYSRRLRVNESEDGRPWKEDRKYETWMACLILPYVAGAQCGELAFLPFDYSWPLCIASESMPAAPWCQIPPGRKTKPIIYNRLMLNVHGASQTRGTKANSTLVEGKIKLNIGMWVKEGGFYTKTSRQKLRWAQKTGKQGVESQYCGV
ncbi:hypothetical protein CPC08DRAFT_729550 [Agrocybe pediades]|nr:hypothetical protein CPC08DRAFT_729550 [Agrocybe pediades]